MGSTGSPTRNNMDGTQMRTKRGDKARHRTKKWNWWHRFKRCPVQSVETEVIFRVNGTHEATNNLDADNSRKVTLPTVEIVKSKTIKRRGSRYASMKNTHQHERNHVHLVADPSRIVPKPEKLPDVDKLKGAGFDEDGCKRIRISDYVKGRKNKHTVDPLKFGAPSGPKVHKPNGPSKGMKAPDSVNIVDNRDFRLVSIDLDRIYGTKFFTATCSLRNAKAKVKKVIMIRKVRNRLNARVMLAATHGINC